MDPFDDSSFGGFPIFFVIFFCIIVGVILFTVIKGTAEWGRNNNSPQLTVAASVKTKRTKTSGGTGNTGASTSYYVTFEYDNGDRQEFKMSGNQYGMLAGGDSGKLSYQGSRFLGFERVST
ncbi:DUF2500 domain-containing protein [Sporosarcina sp. BI001-red]|uniref:DUF2500 domain-containing protein n=1 Tax=Sporosarcina sp. BI001-red TaxID=2282866 RepID=UPI000E2613F6|nr:DUF2500 domain-containing protein [Sporosarcina sp. BI001-red]REB07299.1 DUF2500 domain-containing protein [Sporosarcina sp. BI001-red]